MVEYDITKIKQIFNEHNFSQFEVINVSTNENGTFIHVKEKNNFAEYCRNNFPKRFKFKNNDKVYEAERFYINVNGCVMSVFVIKKDGVILNVFSLYECENPELFDNDYLNLSIDEVIKEEY